MSIPGTPEPAESPEFPVCMKTCGCGAVIAVDAPVFGLTFDNTAAHRGWHAWLLTMLGLPVPSPAPTAPASGVLPPLPAETEPGQEPAPATLIGS
jgi:hypothetical protein